MITATEFTVGTLAQATPLSLMILTRIPDTVILVGDTIDEPAGMFIGGPHNFRRIECRRAFNWSGLLIRNIRIEIDETSLDIGESAGCVIRRDAHLLASCTIERSFGYLSQITLESDLQNAEMSASFSRWQIVIGKGQDKRVLKKIDAKLPPAPNT